MKATLTTVCLLAVCLIGSVAWFRFGPKSSVSYEQECVVAEKAGSPKVLLQVASAWTVARPEDSSAWYWLGEAHSKLRQYSEAAKAFENVALEQLRGVDAATALMKLRITELNQPLEAMELADRLLARDSRLADPRRTRIFFLAMTSQRGQLAREIAAAVEARADAPEHYVYLMTFEDLSFRDGDQVIGKWLAQSPDSEELQIAHAVQVAKNARAAFLTEPSEQLQKKLVAAELQMVDLHNRFPNSNAIIEVLLQFAMDHGNLTAVEKLLSGISDDAIDDPVIWLWLGRYYLRTDDLTRAESALRNAIALHPLGWQTRNELAQVLRASNRVKEAAKEQELAAQGLKLAGEIRRLSHVQEVSQGILTGIANYAVSCEEWPIANGIFRRNAPKAR